MDKRISKASERSNNTTNGTGWIADLSPAKGPADPDQYYTFSTRKTAKEFLSLIDSGMTARDALHKMFRL